MNPEYITLFVDRHGAALFAAQSCLSRSHGAAGGVPCLGEQ